MSLVISPNMNLPIPGVGTQDGPTYAQNVNAALSLIDAHDHSLGNGVQITPSGLNINATLPLNSNPLIGAAYMTLVAQSTPAPILSVYVSGVDLFYRDGNGNAIPITSGGQVAAVSSGITNGSSTASFTANTLVVARTIDATHPSDVQCASVNLGNNVTNSKYLTLSPPNAMANNYTLTLPNVSPSGVQLVSIDTNGNMAPTTTVSATIANNVGTTMTNTGANAVAASRTRTTGASVGIGGIAISGSSGGFSTGSTTPVAITGLAVTLTTSSRPVKLMIQPANGSSTGSFFTSNTNLAVSGSIVKIVNGTTGASFIATWSVGDTLASLSAVDTSVDSLGAAYTYTAYAYSPNGFTTNINNCVLVAYEL